ncbi:MAG: alkaline phosphatase family protein, partial [Nitrososphaerota archaeon]
WACIATGASPGRHGATGFYFHQPGEPLDVGAHPENMGRTFSSTDLTAEHLWTVADREGRRCFIIDYPGSWPPTVKKGIVLRGSTPVHRIADRMVYVTSLSEGKSERETLISFKEAPELQKKVKSSSVPLRGTVKIESEDTVGTVTVDVAVIDSEGKGYDSIIFLDEGPIEEAKPLKVGEWSGCISRDFELSDKARSIDARRHQAVWGRPIAEIEEKRMKGYFWFQLRRLSNDLKDFELLRTHVFTTFDWIYPRELGDKLLRDLPLYIGLGYEPTEKEMMRLGLEPYREKVYSFLNSYRVREAVFIQVIKYVTKNFGWDVCFFHFHLMDTVNHIYMGRYYPQHKEYSKETAIGGEQRGYMMVDWLIGEMLENCVDEQTMIVVVGDHAAVPVWKFVRISGPLIRAGLLSYNWDAEKKAYVVDWSRTKAYPYIEPSYVWINLKGRDPEGIVEPEEYEVVQEKVIEALLSMRDPETGECPFALVLKKKDAWAFGQFGPRVGDVIWYLRPPYTPWEGLRSDFNQWEVPPEMMKSAEIRDLKHAWGIGVFSDHDWYLPWAEMEIFTNSTFLIMAGPGIKKDFKAGEPVWLNSVAPTVAYLLGLRPPAQADGRVIHEAINVSDS